MTLHKAPQHFVVNIWISRAKEKRIEGRESKSGSVEEAGKSLASREDGQVWRKLKSEVELRW